MRMGMDVGEDSKESWYLDMCLHQIFQNTKTQPLPVPEI